MWFWKTRRMRSEAPLKTFADMKFGERLRKARLAKAWGQSALAARSGICAVVLSQYECSAREPSLRNLVRLREALECRWEDLLP